MIYVESSQTATSVALFMFAFKKKRIIMPSLIMPSLISSCWVIMPSLISPCWVIMPSLICSCWVIMPSLISCLRLLRWKRICLLQDAEVSTFTAAPHSRIPLLWSFDSTLKNARSRVGGDCRNIKWAQKPFVRDQKGDAVSEWVSEWAWVSLSSAHLAPLSLSLSLSLAVLRELAQHCTYGDKLTACLGHSRWSQAEEIVAGVWADIGEPAAVADSCGQYRE